VAALSHYSRVTPRHLFLLPEHARVDGSRARARDVPKTVTAGEMQENLVMLSGVRETDTLAVFVDTMKRA